MIFNIQQECTRCGGAIPIENVTVVQKSDGVAHSIHCEFCGVVIEFDRYADNTVFLIGFHERTEPLNYDRAVKRLEASRVA